MKSADDHLTLAEHDSPMALKSTYDEVRYKNKFFSTEKKSIVWCFKNLEHQIFHVTAFKNKQKKIVMNVSMYCLIN